ncbi:sulfotransferase [Aestuariivirga sp.]|uniref:tetratricopeptide repeat-containing sulfotransferase family protein n=1 Tax=Aestuariivirga sp. TaxID=2650926 RepID=UPI0039E2F981
MDITEELLQSNALISAGNLDAAASRVQAILKQVPDNPRAHYLMGRIHLAKLELELALSAAQKAYELDKGAPYTAALLADIYVDLALPEYAFPVLGDALSRKPNDAGLNYTMGRCYMLLEKGFKALPHFEKASQDLGWDNDSITVRMDLSECLGAIGRSHEADTLLDDVIKHRPDHADALFARGMAVSKPVPEWLITELATRAVAPDTNQQDRANFWLALGRCRDVEGQHAEAFDCWSKSRAILGIKRHAMERLDRQMTQSRMFYPQELIDRVAPFGDHESHPILIVGMPRSGTTLTSQVISAHPTCINIGEHDRFHRHDRMFRRNYWRETDHADIIRDAQKGMLKSIASEFKAFFSIFEEGEKKRVVDKSPFNFENLGFIHAIFPKVKIIHCRRHPADNFVSAFQHNMNRSHDYSYGQETYVDRYLAHEEMMRYWKKLFPDQIFELRYEDMVADQETLSRRLIAFCDLPWDDACLNFHERKNTVRTFSRTQVRQPVYSSSVERWRRYESRLGPLFAKLRQRGYDYASSTI